MKKKKLSSKIERYKKYLKRKKGYIARKYNKELRKVLLDKGYFEDEVEAAQKYSLVGKQVLIAREKVVIKKYSKDREKVFIKDRGWVTSDSLERILRMRIYWARVKAYKELLGVEYKEAKEVYRVLRVPKKKKLKEVEGTIALKKLLY